VLNRMEFCHDGPVYTRAAAGCVAIRAQQL
jgi:hypothetical protein